MKRVFGILAGLVLVALGLGLVAAGTLGIVTFGTEGRYVSEPTRLQPSEGSLALVSDLVGVEVGIPLSEHLGSATISATPAGEGSVFMGVGPQPDVDGYLFGVPYDLVSRNGGGAWTATPVPGINSELAPPFDLPFWVDQSTGNRPAIDVSDRLAQQTLVIMSADGTPAVPVDLTVGFSGARIFPSSVTAVVLGLVLLVIGIPGLLRWGRGKRPHEAAPAPLVTAAAEASAVPDDHEEESAAAYPPSAGPDQVVDLAGGSATEASLHGWFREGDKTPGSGSQ